MPQDRASAAHWFRAAAALGEGMGHANDGMMRLRAAGAGAGREAAGAVRALRRAAKLQDPSGWAGLAYAHLYGAGVKQVRVRVRVRVRVSRVSPNPKPKPNPKQSDEMAVRAMCKAAQSGHLDSIFNLGVLWLQVRLRLRLRLRLRV